MRTSRNSQVPAREGTVRDIAVFVPLDPYLPLKALAGYSGISVRKLREYLDDQAHPLPHYRLGGKIVVRRSEFDQWMTAFRGERQLDLDLIASEAVDDLRHALDAHT